MTCNRCFIRHDPDVLALELAFVHRGVIDFLFPLSEIDRSFVLQDND